MRAPGDTTLLSKGTIDVSANNAGSGSTLSLNGLTLGQSASDTSTLNFSAGHPASPELAIGFDGLTANGGNNSVTVNLNDLGALPATYTLATYSGVIGGTGSSAFVLGSQTNSGLRNAAGSLVVTGGSINYVLTGNYPVWQGTKGSLWTAGSNWVLNNSTSQTTFVTGDTVVFDDTAGTAGGTTSVSISGANVSPSAVTFNNNNFNYTLSGTNGIAGSGLLAVNGTGSVTLSMSNGYSGGTFVNAGTLIVANSSGVGLGSGPVNINGGVLMANNSGGTATGNTVNINTGGMFIANNSGGTATSGSPININSGGTLQIGNGNARGTLGTVPIDNGVFAFSRSDSMTYAGVINGSGSVVQRGPGLLTLTSTTSGYTGGTVVSGGTLGVNTDANLGAVPSFTDPANITLNGGALRFNAGSLQPGVGVPGSYTINTNRGITLGPSGGTINANFVNTVQTINNETALWYTGVIAGSGGLTFTGTGGWNAANQSIVVLDGNSTYAGGTTINNAVLAFGDSGGPYTSILPATTVLNLVNSGALNIDTTNTTATIAGLTGDPTGLVGTCNQSGAAGLIIDSTGNYTYNGVISAFTYAGKLGTNARISLTMSGSGSQTLTGSSAYAGGTTVSSGTLVLGNNAAIGTGGLTANGGLTDLHGFNPTVSSLSGAAGMVTNKGASNSLLTVTQGATTTFSGTISDGPTNKTALSLTTGTLILDGSNTYSGATTIGVGSTLQLGSSDSNGSIGNSVVSDSGALVVSRSDAVNLTSLISGSLTGSGSLVYNGGGTLTLTGTNTYSGGTVVNSGEMIVMNPAAIEDGTNLTVGVGPVFPAPVVLAPVAGSAAAAVPEPGTLALIAAAALSIGILRRRGSRGTKAKQPCSD